MNIELRVNNEYIKGMDVDIDNMTHGQVVREIHKELNLDLELGRSWSYRFFGDGPKFFNINLPR
jgi:hypothetical protein